MPAPTVTVKAKDVVLPTARGNYGASVSDTKKITVTIVDARLLPDEIGEGLGPVFSCQNLIGLVVIAHAGPV